MIVQLEKMSLIGKEYCVKDIRVKKYYKILFYNDTYENREAVVKILSKVAVYPIGIICGQIRHL